MEGKVLDVLVVDDDELFLRTLEILVEHEDGARVIGAARNGEVALELAERLRPDVVVMDVDMPVLNGIEATKRILEAGFVRQIVIVSGSDVEAHSNSAHAAGAVAFVSKSRVGDELPAILQALRRA